MTRILKVHTYIYSREDSDSRHAVAEILQLEVSTRCTVFLITFVSGN